MGDGKNYSTSTTGVLHSYSSPGYYTIRAVGTNKQNKKAEAATTIYIAEGNSHQHSLAIVPSFTYKNNTIVYTLKTTNKGSFDNIVRSSNNKDESKKGPTESINKTFSESGKYTIRAKGYYQGELKAIASIVIQHGDKTLFSYLETNNTTLQQPAKFTTKLIGVKLQDIEQIIRNRGDGEITTNKELTTTHIYTSSGIKTISQNIILTNGKNLENIVSMYVENSFKSQSMALNINGKSLSYPQNQATNLQINILPKTITSAINIRIVSENNSKNYNNTPLSNIIIQESYNNMGQKSVATYGEINRCVSLYNQGSVNIAKNDLCYNALKN